MTTHEDGDVDQTGSEKIDLSRVLILGCSCSGKTTLARQLSNVVGAQHIELDSLNWGPNWTQRPHEDLRHEVESFASQRRWVVDGCYFAVQDILWPRATAAIWLNYSGSTVAWRAITRTTRRAAFREELYNGNRESFRRSFFSSDSVLFWAMKSFRLRRRQITALLDRPEFRHIQVREFKRPRECQRFLSIQAPIARLKCL